MNFSKTTSYAITVLHYLAKQNNTRYSAKELNISLQIPWPYLRQLLTSLKKEGFLESSKGRFGGFILSRKPEEISLADIVTAIEGKEIFNTCIMGFTTCPFDKKCAMHDAWAATRANMIDVLKTTNLASFR